jgi:hypothetical protein
VLLFVEMTGWRTCRIPWLPGNLQPAAQSRDRILHDDVITQPETLPAKRSLTADNADITGAILKYKNSGECIKIML